MLWRFIEIRTCFKVCSRDSETWVVEFYPSNWRRKRHQRERGRMDRPSILAGRLLLFLSHVTLGEAGSHLALPLRGWRPGGTTGPSLYVLVASPENRVISCGAYRSNLSVFWSQHYIPMLINYPKITSHNSFEVSRTTGSNNSVFSSLHTLFYSAFFFFVLLLPGFIVLRDTHLLEILDFQIAVEFWLWPTRSKYSTGLVF